MMMIHGIKQNIREREREELQIFQLRMVLLSPDAIEMNFFFKPLPFPSN